MSIKDSINGLILIDCWEPCYDDPSQNQIFNEWFELLSKKLLKKYNFTKILDATINSKHNSNIQLKQVLGKEKYQTVINASEVVEISRQNNIADWLVVGTTWQVCTHLNSVGLLMFREVTRDTDLKFYGIDRGFLKENNVPVTDIDYILDSVRWIKKEKNLWLIAPARAISAGDIYAVHSAKFFEGPEYHILRAKYENAITH